MLSVGFYRHEVHVDNFCYYSTCAYEDAFARYKAYCERWPEKMVELRVVEVLAIRQAAPRGA